MFLRKMFVTVQPKIILCKETIKPSNFNFTSRLGRVNGEKTSFLLKSPLNTHQLAGGMKAALPVILWGGSFSLNAPQLAVGLFTGKNRIN